MSGMVSVLCATASSRPTGPQAGTCSSAQGVGVPGAVRMLLLGRWDERKSSILGPSSCLCGQELLLLVTRSPSFSWLTEVRNCQIVFIITFPSAEYRVSHTVNTQLFSSWNWQSLFCGFSSPFLTKMFFHPFAFQLGIEIAVYHRKYVCVHAYLCFQSSMYTDAVIWFSEQYYKVIFSSCRWRNRSFKINPKPQ